MAVDNKARLRFKGNLLEKGISSDTLLTRLKILCTELQNLEVDPDMFDKGSLTPVSTQLIHKTILFHKDPGVKAYAACALADMLRCCAPDAPYDETALVDIFTFFLNLLTTNLKPAKTIARGGMSASGAKSEYYKQYFYLVDSLATIKSVVLIWDFDNGEHPLVPRYFKEILDMVRYDLPTSLVTHFTDILISLLDEGTTVPVDVRNSLLFQFDRDLKGYDEKSMNVAAEALEHDYNDPKVERSVGSYFADIMISNSSLRDSPGPSHHSDEDDNDISGSEVNAIQRAHKLLLEISALCPKITLSLIPLLSSELATPSAPHRRLAVKTLGAIFGHGKMGSDVISKCEKAWDAWIGREKDSDVNIREEWVKAVGRVFKNGEGSAKKQLEPHIRMKLNDPEVSIRLSTAKLFASLSYETILLSVKLETLKELSGRMKDRKPLVRQAACDTLCVLYNKAAGEIESEGPDGTAAKRFGWIPSDVLECTFLGQDRSIREMVELNLFTHILPLPSKGDAEDEASWVDRYLLVMRHLTPSAQKALFALSGFNAQRTILLNFLRACEEFNGGIIDKGPDVDKIQRRLNAFKQGVANMMPDAAKAVSDLSAFANANENRLYKILKSASDPQTDLRNLIKLQNEFYKRVEGISSSILGTFKIFFRRVCFPFVNKSSIPTLLKHLTDADDSTAENAYKTLYTVAKHVPLMFKSHVAELGKIIIDPKYEVRVEVAMQALAHVGRQDLSVATNDKKVIERATHFVLEGTTRQAKFGARLLAFSKAADVNCTAAMEALAELIQNNPNSDDSATHMKALTEFAHSAPDQFEPQSDVIVKFILKNFKASGEIGDKDEDDWTNEGDISPRGKAILESLKTLTERCIAHSDNDEAIATAAPVFRLLFNIIAYHGAIVPDDCSNIKTRVRLQAVRCILKLACIAKYDKQMRPQFNELAIMVQDPCFEVRFGFLSKLVALVNQQKLHPRYQTIMILTAHDPEQEPRDLAKNSLAACTRTSQDAFHSFVMVFTRLLHTVAHHPDFSTEPEDLKNIAKYIDYYLDIVANKDTVSLLYTLAGKCKTVRDCSSNQEGDNRNYSENLYIVSELAQTIILTRRETNQWTLHTYEKEIVMPHDIFRPLSTDAAKKNTMRVYLAEETLDFLKHSIGKPVKDIKPKKAKAAVGSSKRKAKAPAAPKRSSKKKRKDADSDEDDDDESTGDEDQMDVDDPIEEEEKEEDEESVEPVLGRGGKRKAALALKSMTKPKLKPKPKTKAAESDDEEEEEEKED